MLILMVLIYVLNENRIINLSSPKLILIELIILVILILEVRFIIKFIVEKTKFKKK